MEDSVVEIAKFINCTGVLNGKSVREYLNTRFVNLNLSSKFKTFPLNFWSTFCWTL